MEEKRSLYFTSQGFRSQEIEIAPDVSDVYSKRRPLIENEDKVLDVTIVELDESTRAKNRAFQERLDEIWRTTDGWEARLRREAQDAVDSVTSIRDDYQKHIDNFTKSLKTEINAIFDKFDLELIPEQSARVDVIDKDVDFFFRDTVPARIEKQSGEVSRQLKRQYETFDIEKKKELKRETKLVQKASKHVQNTAQRFEDENALQSACFLTLEDDVVEHERHAVRMHLIRNAAAADQIIALNEISAKESAVREVEDVDALDTVIETQGILQQTVLMHFGTKPFDEDELPSTDRLNSRMAKIHDKHAAAEEGEDHAATAAAAAAAE